VASRAAVTHDRIGIYTELMQFRECLVSKGILAFVFRLLSVPLYIICELSLFPILNFTLPNRREAREFR
jgi:hypothetical protein